MRKVHFFKAKSRIGLANKPIHQEEFNFGVEDGPEGILSPDFLSSLAGSHLANVDSFSFTNPEDIKPGQFSEVLAGEIIQFRNLIVDKIATPRQGGARNDEKVVQVIIGGDHCVTFPSVLAALERSGQNLGIIYFDSHGDINLSKDSPTGNFHGMHLRPLFDKFDIPEIDNLVPTKIPTKNLLYIGNLDLDPGEIEFLSTNRIRNITGDDLENRQDQSLEEIKSFISRLDHLYVSFDIDCMDKTEAPATGIPAEHGLYLKDILPVLELIKNHPNFSFDLCEVNPKKEGEEETVKLAQEILKLILGFERIQPRGLELGVIF